MDAAILAGGQARRFGGRNKSALPIGTASILERQLVALTGVADRVLVIAGDPDRYRGHRVDVVPDLVPDRGPLGGLYTALRAARSSHVLVLACDLPFVSPALLGALARLAGDRTDAVVPRTGDGWQPLCAVYARRLAPRLRRHIESGDLKIVRLLAGIRTREVGPNELAAIDPDDRLFLNVNTADDLARAERLVGRRDDNHHR